MGLYFLSFHCEDDLAWIFPGVYGPIQRVERGFLGRIRAKKGI